MDEIIDIDSDIMDRALRTVYFSFSSFICNKNGDEIKLIIEHTANQLQKVRNEQKKSSIELLTTIYNWWEDGQELELQQIFKELNLARK